MRIFRQLAIFLVGFCVLGYVALVAYAYWPVAENIPVRELSRDGDRFVTVDGVDLRYRTYGTQAPGRPNLLLIHGFANSLQSWRDLAPLLARDAYVVAIDLPGYGLSDKPVEFDYHNGPQASVMVAAARALGLEHTIYVGHSLGGTIALHAVVQDADAGGLVLMNPGIITTGVPKIVQLTFPPLPRLAARQFASREFRASALRNSYEHPEVVTEQVVDDVMLASRSEGYMRGMTSLMKQYAEGEEIALLDDVHVPTLIVWGDADRNKLRSEADELQRAIAGAELVRFADAGHYVHEEQPQGVAAAMLEAFARWQHAQVGAPVTPLEAGPSATTVTSAAAHRSS